MAPLEILEIGEHAAALAETQQSGTRNMADAIRAVWSDLNRSPALSPDGLAADHFPASPLTIVPLAIALGVALPSADAAILLAANTGGDSDSVASIAAAILGARDPGTVNEDWYAVVEAVNGHDLGALARDLAQRRR
jgi:hypothetical protein